MHGDDVKKLQRALLAAGLLPKRKGTVDGVYGPQTAAACEKAKYRLGYPTRKIHPGHEIAGDELMSYLTGKKRLPAAYRARRAIRLDGNRGAAKATTHPAVIPTKRETIEQGRRDTIVKLARWGVAHEQAIHYAQRRPMKLPAVGTTPWTTDCSEFVTTIYKWAGAPDPNGLRYRGEGYTGTLLSHLKPIPARLVQKGDLVVYGGGTGHHVCVVVDDGPDPLLVSHGQEAGPILIRHSEEARYQPSTVTWLQGVMQ
jgi:hypothetical protein